MKAGCLASRRSSRRGAVRFVSGLRYLETGLSAGMSISSPIVVPIRGKRIEIGKDLVALNQRIDSSDLVTAIWPRGKGEELEQEEGEEDRDPAYGR